MWFVRLFLSRPQHSNVSGNAPMFVPLGSRSDSPMAIRPAGARRGAGDGGGGDGERLHPHHGAAAHARGDPTVEHACGQGRDDPGARPTKGLGQTQTVSWDHNSHPIWRFFLNKCILFPANMISVGVYPMSPGVCDNFPYKVHIGRVGGAGGGDW